MRSALAFHTRGSAVERPHSARISLRRGKERLLRIQRDGLTTLRPKRASHTGTELTRPKRRGSAVFRPDLRRQKNLFDARPSPSQGGDLWFRYRQQSIAYLQAVSLAKEAL